MQALYTLLQIQNYNSLGQEYVQRTSYLSKGKKMNDFIHSKNRTHNWHKNMYEWFK